MIMTTKNALMTDINTLSAQLRQLKKNGLEIILLVYLNYTVQQNVRINKITNFS